MFAFLVAIAIVAIFILGYSITLFRKGHHIQTDVGCNDDMKRMGLECTSQLMRREEAELRGEKYDAMTEDCSSDHCCTCTLACNGNSLHSKK